MTVPGFPDEGVDHVHGDSKEPGTELTRTVVLVEMPKHPDEDLLGGIGGILGIAEHPATEAVDGALPLEDEVSQTGLVPRLLLPRSGFAHGSSVDRPRRVQRGVQ